MGELEIAPLRHVRFPGTAGRLQDTGRYAELWDELGDNYGLYHEYLADELERRGSRLPDPADYRQNYSGYAGAAAAVIEIVVAERILRTCAGLRGKQQQSDLPLIDQRQRLVSGNPERETRYGRQGALGSDDWTPPAPLAMPG